jgi:hypothetical protein
MEKTFEKPFDVWRAMLKEIADRAQDPESANSIPAALHPYIQQLHQQIGVCECKHGSCTDCHSGRRVLSWIWDKMDEGF